MLARLCQQACLYDSSKIAFVPAVLEGDFVHTGENCLALPKLNLQFLTFQDYLLRNFNLFRLEATYEIREDISDVIGRVAAFRSALAASSIVLGAGKHWHRPSSGTGPSFVLP